MDDLDQIKFKQQEQEKDMTANKLQSAMLQSDNVALKTEKDKLLVELKETRKLQSVFEKKCAEQIEQLNKLKQEHQEVRKQNIGADELAREREDRISKLKDENLELKEKLEKLDDGGEENAVKTTLATIKKLWWGGLVGFYLKRSCKN